MIESSMQEEMSATSYKNMLNNVGDIYEAIGAICNLDTADSAGVRALLQLNDHEAMSIVSHLGSLAENANLLLRCCNLSEKDVRDTLGLGSLVQLLLDLHLKEWDETPAPVLDSDAETDPPTPPWRKPPQAHFPSPIIQSSGQLSQPPPPPPRQATLSQPPPPPPRQAASQSSGQIPHPPPPPPRQTLPTPLPPPSVETRQPDQLPPPPAAMELCPPKIHRDDKRFHHERKLRTFKCDRCGTWKKLDSQTKGFDGDWVQEKSIRRLPVNGHQAGWQAGHDYRWWCLSCIAEVEGWGDTPEGRNSAAAARGKPQPKWSRRTVYWFCHGLPSQRNLQSTLPVIITFP